MNKNILDVETRRFGQLLHGLCAILTVASVGAAYLFLYTPMVEGSGEVRVQIDKVRTKLRKAPQIRREHSQLQDRLAEVRKRMRHLRTRVPEDDLISEFVSQVTEAAEKEGITISDFDAGQRVQQASYSEREITFTGTGKHVSICHFVNRVQKLPRLTRVTGLEVHTESVGQEVYPVTLRVLVYFGLTVDSATEDGSEGPISKSEFGGGALDD